MKRVSRPGSPRAWSSNVGTQKYDWSRNRLTSVGAASRIPFVENIRSCPLRSLSSRTAPSSITSRSSAAAMSARV